MDSTTAPATAPALTSWRRDIAGGLVAGVITVVFALSHGALLFPGALSAWLPFGIGLCLVTSALGAFWMAWRSQLPFAIAGSDANVTSILAAAAATFAAGGAAGKPALENVFALVTLASLLCALVFLALGFARLATAVRYIPYPVIAGFLAATGWMISLGALHVGADAVFSVQWFATAAFGLAFAGVFRRWKQPGAMPLVLAACGVAVLGALWAAGLDAHEARAAGWLFAQGAAPRWIAPWQFVLNPAAIDWAWIARHLLDMLAVVAVGLISVLLGATGLEVMAQRDISLNRELRTHGWLGLASTLAGGMIALVSITRSAALLAGAGPSRLAGMVAAVVCAAAAPFAVQLVSWVPRPVLAGFLLSLGLALLWEWLVASRSRTSRGDWLMIVAMLAVAAIFGFAFSVLVGIVASCIAFAVSYSRAGVVQHELDGRGIHSRVMRPADHREVLARRGAALRVMILRGVIFFGTAHSLLERVRPFLERKDVDAASAEGRRAAPGLRVLVLDFDHVAGIDSSAVMTFSKVAQLAASHGARVFVSGAPAERLEEANAADAGTGALQRFTTLEQALDAAEEDLLRDAARDPGGGRAQPQRWFTHELGGEEHWRALAPLLQCRALVPGEVLLRQGDVSDTTLYLIESGRLEVTLDGQAQGQRLACLMAGNLVGEMALYDNANRSATVRALSGTTVWALSRDALERLNATAPETALRVHAIVMRTMAARVQEANATIAALQRGA